jgi:hypothetical protein
MDFITLIVGVVTPILMGAFTAALKYKEKNLGSGEEFSDAKFYATIVVAAAIGLVNFFTDGILVSSVDLQTQLFAYAGVIVLLETGIKLVFRGASQSPAVVTALVGKDAGEAVKEVVADSPGGSGGYTEPKRTIFMAEANFRWMTFGHSNEDIVKMKAQVMAAEAAGLKHYYVTWSGGVYLVEFGEVYGTNLQLAYPGIVPAPGASGT